MTRPVASYDVFDTIVTRRFAHPRDLYVYLGTRLPELGLGSIDAWDFARARWAAELGARQKSPWTEVLLDDIYRELAATFSWDGNIAAKVRALELAIESQHLRGMPLMAEPLAAARAVHGRLVFLSDMYLPATILRPWLEREGVCDPADLLLISGEARGNKSSGALFETAKKATGGDFSRWHHTGDHPFADVEKPRRLGATATHFTRAHLTARERAVRATTGEFTAPWRSLLAGAMRLARLARAPASPRETVLWEAGTNVAGPLFYGFVRWVLAEAERRGLRQLYFAARDGQIFLRIAQAIQAAEPSRVECRYLHASRLVFSGPVELSDEEALRRLVVPPAYFHSLRQVLAALALDETWAASGLPENFKRFDPDANLSWEDRTSLADWLLAKERRPVIQAALLARNRRTREYLNAAGLGRDSSAGLVDTGWYGNGQANLERLIGGDGPPVALTGFYLGVKTLPPLPPVGPRLGYTNRHSVLPLAFDVSHKVLLELMAQSDHGQVIDFRKGTDGPIPVLGPTGRVNLAEIRLFQDAILTFVSRMLEVERLAPAPEAERAATVIGLYRDLHDHPAAQEVEVLGFLPHSDQLFEQYFSTLCLPPKTGRTVRALIDYRRRPPHWWMQGQAALGSALPIYSYRFLKRMWWWLRGKKTGIPQTLTAPAASPGSATAP